MPTPTPTPPDGDASPAGAGTAAPPTTATATPAATDATPKSEIGDRWGMLPTPERRAELDARLAEWAAMPDHGTLRGPFDMDGWDSGLDGADVYYLAARSWASLGGNVADNIAEALEMLNDRGDAYVTMPDLHLEGAHLGHAQLQNAQLGSAHLEYAFLPGAHLDYAFLGMADMRHATLYEAHLEHATFFRADIEHAMLWEAHLEHAELSEAHLEHTELVAAHLERADLRGAYFDAGTDLTGTSLGNARWWDRFVPWTEPDATALGDIHWSGVGTVDLTRIDWEDVQRLGDERYVTWHDGAEAHASVVRVYRQVATQLRAQGLNEPADQFAHRAYVLNRGVLLRRALRNPLRLPAYLGSWLLALLAGYGFRPGRTILCYLAVVLGFALAYTHFGHIGGQPFTFDEAVVFSLTSFHGRGFFPGPLSLHDPVTRMAAAEAVLGLLIEVSFIATFTQRFFGK